MVMVFRVDRLSRHNPDLQPTAFKWLGMGVVLYFGDIGLVDDFNNLAFTIFGWQGGTEWVKITERTSGGRNDKALKEKKIVMSGHPPYGYRTRGQER